MGRPKKESTSLTKEKKRAASAVGMSEVHMMGGTMEARRWLTVPWGAITNSDYTNKEELK